MVKAARSPAAPKPPAEAAPAKSVSAKSPVVKPAGAEKPVTPKSVTPKSVAQKSAATVAGTAKSATAKPKPAPKPAAKKAVAKGTTGSRAERGAAAVGKPRASAKAAPSSASALKRSATAAPKPTSASKPTKAAGKPTQGVACAPINLGFLSGFVGFHLRLAQDASYRAFARFKDKDLVKPGRFPALAIIHLNPGISQSALGRAIARDKSTVSPLIKDLQKNGLISRKPSPNDRRSVTLNLTKKGERVLDRLHARALEHEADLDKVIGASKSRLVGMLDKITGSLTAS